MKSLDALGVRARVQESEIDNMWSVLACVPEEAMERYKASAEYTSDLEASSRQLIMSGLCTHM